MKRDEQQLSLVDSFEKLKVFLASAVYNSIEFVLRPLMNTFFRLQPATAARPSWTVSDS